MKQNNQTQSISQTGLFFATLGLSVAVLGACAQMPEQSTHATQTPKTTQEHTVTTQSAILASTLQGQWVLERATDAHGNSILALMKSLKRFDEPLGPVTLVFEANKMRVSNLCNIVFGTYSLHTTETGDTVLKTPLMSTKMLCSPQVMQREDTFTRMFDRPVTISIGEGNPKRLTLTGNKGDAKAVTMVFVGQ